MNGKLIKALEFSVAVIGMVMPLITDYLNEKRMDNKINLAVEEAITKKEIIDAECEDAE